MIKKIIAFSLAAVLSFTATDFSLESDSSATAASQQDIWFRDFDTRINGGEPIRGVDISSIISVEKSGVKFYDDYGMEQDIFKTLAEHGINYIRVRVWNEPYDANGHSYGGGNADLNNAAEIGKRAAKYGMKLLVDIQYSDFWADPKKQTRPKYWMPHDHETLKGEIYKWTSWVLSYITDAGGDIGMVQVGNETNCFFCGETDMYKICDLFASGDKAVRDFDRNILIAHHFANPALGHYAWYAEIMDKCHLDYDVFATSYYSYWHGTTENLTKVMKDIGEKYHKYVMVAETAYPYTHDDGDHFKNTVNEYSANDGTEYEFSIAGQTQSLTDVFQAIANTGRYGIGVFYWEPAWIGVYGNSWEENHKLWETYGCGWTTGYAASYDSEITETGGASFDNQALFDFTGKPHSSLDVFTRVYPQTKKELPPDDFLRGDLDGDGILTSFDLVLLRNDIIRSKKSHKADFNADNSCNIADIVLLTEFLLND